MEEFNKNKLKSLSPGQRIKKLKMLEEERIKEVSEIEKLIRQSVQELKTDEFAAKIAPEQRDVDISRLFGSEEERLEKTVRKELIDEGGASYIGVKEAVEDYKALQDISYASMMGTISQVQRKTLDKIGERLDTRKYVSASAEAADILVASRASLNKIRKYTRSD
ncbi:hypothetical protein J4458_07125 [Candidatus Woesearchaeota archaeon]|nr:hypothetical protein [Candidatus Woesearchaeota archaeon]